MEFDAIKLLQFSDLVAVCLHPHVAAGELLHHLVDNHLRVPWYEVALSAKLGGCLNAAEESLVLYNIVSGLEMEMVGVPQFVATGGYEENPCPFSLNHEGAIKVHGLVLYLGRDRRGLLFSPLCHEISEHLGFDRHARTVSDVEAHELKPHLAMWPMDLWLLMMSPTPLEDTTTTRWSLK
jgi:hypothetical protein